MYDYVAISDVTGIDTETLEGMSGKRLDTMESFLDSPTDPNDIIGFISKMVDQGLDVLTWGNDVLSTDGEEFEWNRCAPQNLNSTWYRYDDETIEALGKEIHDCNQVRSWTHGSTRSGWVTGLSELRANMLVIDGKNWLRVDLIENADTEAQKLAEEVADRLADDEDTIGELEAGHDDGSQGNRDGYIVAQDGSVTAYASFRTWRSQPHYECAEKVSYHRLSKESEEN